MAWTNNAYGDYYLPRTGLFVRSHNVGTFWQPVWEYQVRRGTFDDSKVIATKPTTGEAMRYVETIVAIPG